MRAVADTKSEHHSARLNEAQRRAAGFNIRDKGDGASSALLVIAGAGTGKTSTLAHRVAQLIAGGVNPERILLLTFSRRAAREMSGRARRIVEISTRVSVRLVWSGTFHSIANRLLRRYASHIGLHPAFTVIDRSDAADLMDLVRHDLGFSAKKRRFPRKHTCLDIYSRAVNTRRPLAEVLQDAFPWCLDWQTELGQLFRGYVEQKQASNVLDYDDLLLYWHTLMGEPKLAAGISRRFDHVLVDEYQDTNTLQAQILLRLKPGGDGLTVVGDDAQSIYSFRAACIDNILDFPQQFEVPAKVITLETNYRSVQPILDASNALMADSRRRYRKSLKAACGGGAAPLYVTVADDEGQAEYTINQVLDARERGQLLRQQAVLFRSSHHSDRLELELMRRNIPYVKYGGLKFLEAAHVKDLLAILRWCENPRDRIAMFRVVQLLDGFGPGSAARAYEFLGARRWRLSTLAEFNAPSRAREEWRGLTALMISLARPGPGWPSSIEQAARWYRAQLERIYENAQVRVGDIDQLEQIAGQFSSQERFLTELTLDPPAATGDLAGPPLLDEDYLILSTVHSAKGQEWDSVFVLNVADGNFPSEFAAGDARKIEEERRLLYVAMTRAKKALHLIAPLRYYVPEQARHGDRHVYGARSRFMTDDLLKCFERISWPHRVAEAVTPESPGKVFLDVGGKLRNMW